MPILLRGCKGCGHRFEILSLSGVESNLDRGGDEDVLDCSCAECGGIELEALVSRPMEQSRKYPYFDHGLGRTITSYRHWRQVCTELGVVATEGESIGTWTDILDKDEAQIARDEAKYKAYVDEMSQGPARGEWFGLLDHLRRENPGVRFHGEES